jgi:hypothetical protein
MLGHGTLMRGGDADHVGLVVEDGAIVGKPPWYSLPRYLDRFSGLRRHSMKVDIEDGRADGLWMGNRLFTWQGDPAWVSYQGDAIVGLLERSRYGVDSVPDLFMTNFKVSDIMGHRYTMESPEMGAIIAAQDAELGRLVDFLDRKVRDYVVVVTADHGHTPPWNVTGGWPIDVNGIPEDVNEHFDVPEGRSIVRATSPDGLFLRHSALRDLGIPARAVARFLNHYTIADNWPNAELPDGYEERGDERLFAATFLRSQMRQTMTCAFGAHSPPQRVAA